MANTAVKETPVKTLEEVRRDANIMINLRASKNLIGEDGDVLKNPCETVTVNGKTYQIRCNEPVAVPWEVYDVLSNSERYRNERIRC